MRTCPFHGCKATMPDRIFCCRQHWFRLSAPHRHEVNAAYDDYMNDRIDLPELRHRPPAAGSVGG